MGKNLTIYFSDEALELIEHLEGKGSLINKLVIEHFSNDEETLRRKVELAEQEFNALNAKLKMKVSQRLDMEAKRTIERKKSESEIKRKEEVEEMKRKLAAGEITEDEYFEFFDK